MANQSAGLLMYRVTSGVLQVLLVHPGGPYWVKKEAGAWSIPKGKVEKGEEPLAAARREFEEETGKRADGVFTSLEAVTQRGGKRILAWAFEDDFDPSQLQSMTYSMEWPPRSGLQREFPEVDRAAWFTIEEAKRYINPGQIPLLNELLAMRERT